MDAEDRVSSTQPRDLAGDEATATNETVPNNEHPMRLYFGNGPRVHAMLRIEYGMVHQRCERCGEVGQLTCFSSSFRKWALRRVTREEMNLTCSLCKLRGHKYSNCDLRVITHRRVEERRQVHCGVCGEAGHNRRTCEQAGRH